MFERFTEHARQVVVLAQDEARALRHDFIGTEHLLLGLVRVEDGLAAPVLESFDITLEEARAKVALLVPQADELRFGQIPFTSRAKRVLELALAESLSLGHDYIGTEHLLLALVRESDGVGMRVLRDLGADGERIRGEVVRLLSARGEAQERRPFVPPKPAPEPPAARSRTRALVISFVLGLLVGRASRRH